MKIFVLILFCSFNILLAQSSLEEHTFIFSSMLGNSQSLVLGYDPFGTDSIDENLGEMAVPQVTTGNFGVRFQLPVDTSIYTTKDIRFGCGQPFSYTHLIDIRHEYTTLPVYVDWEWDMPLWIIYFINPYNGQTLATFQSNFDSSFYQIPALKKILIRIQYNGPLSWPEYNLSAPNGGEVIRGGESYNISWSSNNLSPFMDLEFSSNGGLNWEYIAQNISTNQNAYSWNVPIINSDRCLIRIGSYPCSYDKSSGSFVVYENNPPVLYSVDIPFWITDGVNDSIYLIAGMHPLATNGLDSSLGEMSIQFPPIGNFAAGMIINNDILSLKDYKPGYSSYIGDKVYYFKVQPELDTTVYIRMHTPDGVRVSLFFIKYVPNGFTFIDTTFYSSEINYKFPSRTRFSSYSTWLPGIQLTLSFDGSIPVELFHFTASLFENNIILKWATVSETNNKGFEVERRLTQTLSKGEGLNEWTLIGFVEGNGTTTKTCIYSFEDRDLPAGEYLYRLKQIDFDGTYRYYYLNEALNVHLSKQFELSQNYPNPFNPSTKISWQSPVGSHQTLIVYDVLGNEVTTLVNEYKPAGSYEVEFKSTVGSHQLASGVYYYQLKAGEFVQTKKMILMR